MLLSSLTAGVQSLEPHGWKGREILTLEEFSGRVRGMATSQGVSQERGWRKQEFSFSVLTIPHWKLQGGAA